MLFWTDNQTEPKKINIEKFKTGSTDFNTHTKIPKYIPNTPEGQPQYEVDLTGTINFTEEDITVIKKSPLAAPIVDASASKYGNGVPGTGTTPVSTQMTSPAGMVNFTFVENINIAPDDRIPLNTYGEYLVNIESDPDFYDESSIPNWNGEVTFTVNTSPQWEVEDLITLESEFTTDFFINYNWKISILLTSVNNTTITGRIQAISSNIETFEDEDGNTQIYTWEGLLVEDAPMFEYVFPRFAFRWKYINNEYSTFSPFSLVAFVGKEFEYLSSDGYNVGMTNNIRKLIIGNLSWGSEEVVELDILYKESNSTAVYTVDTLKRADFTTLPSTFEIETELIGAIVQSNQLLRPWDNVPRAAKAQEVIGNRIVYANYLQNYNVNEAFINLISLPNNHSSVADPEQIRFPNESVKSIRTYQAGVVFIDKFGRETPVFTSKQGSTKVDIADSNKANKLAVTPTGTPPDFATHYKFFIKENSNEYYNLALDKFYNAEDGNVWLSFPSSERNKVDMETYLILKKQHDTNVTVDALARYKILDIKSEAPEFISTFDSVISSAVVTLQQTVETGYLVINFEGPDSSSNPQFGPNLNGNKVRFSTSASKSAIYEVADARTSLPQNNNFSYELTLNTPLGPDAVFMQNIQANSPFNITILEDKTKNLPEFEGRFFVKINRDFSFDTNIIASFAAMAAQYAIKDEWVPTGVNAPNEPSSNPRGYWYTDTGNTDNPWVCSDNAHKLKLRGWGGGIGSWITGSNEPGISEYFSQYQPPTRGSRKFGIITTRNAAPNDYIDLMMGHVLSQQLGNNSTGTGVTPNGHLSTGATIRFQSKDETKLSQEYTISFSLGMWSRRGKVVWSGDCTNSGASVNFRYAIYIELDKPISEEWMPSYGSWSQLESVLPSIQAVQRVISNNDKLLSSTNPAIFETEPKEKVDLDIYYEASDSLPISNFSTVAQPLNWFNCYSYGQGVESNRIRDDFNAVTIDKGVKASTVLDEPYAEERRASGFIFSQIFNSTSGINRLNQFIQAEPITKDLNPIHGSIQKLHARDTDLITLCEDKCFRVLANKDALFNADGNTNLTGNRAVLGQTVPYAGNFGISTNPESFADFGFRLYFSDKNRGAIIRLSRDGITEISTYGMGDFFSDNLRSSTVIKGSYDEDKGLYNLSLNKLTEEWEEKLSTDQSYNLTAECENPAEATGKVTATTLSFKETVNGWTSRKSFLPEEGVSLNNIYYTFKNGLLWQHNANPVYNNFYGTQYFSSFNLLVNEAPQAVKGFTALNYSGTASREIEYQYLNKWYSIAEVNANQLLPTASQVKREGWYTNFIRTNLEAGEIKEFENKEGKYFNYIKALEVCKTGDGIGSPDTIDPDPLDFLLTVTIDTDCGGSGGTDPDTTQFFFNVWDAIKNDPVFYTNIINETTAQDAKCTIEGYYNLVNQTYSQVTNEGVSFSYVLTDGLEAGTQMYNSITNEPITQAGTYLFAGIGQQQNDIVLNHAGLDANNSTVVPTTYYIMILNSSGVIASYTQYSTLTACQGDPDRSLKGTGGFSTTLTLEGYNFSIPVQTNAQIWCGTKAYMEAWLLLDPNFRGMGWWVPEVFWYGPGNFQVGTQLYSYTNSLGFFKKNHNSEGLPGAYGRKEVYKLGSYWNGTRVPIGGTFTSNTNIEDEWFIVTTSNVGIITAIDQYNQLNPTCP